MFNVLVVDDSKFAINKVVKALENLNIECNILATANDGIEGLDAYIKYRPNLVVTDIEMPNMDGKEFISNLKQLNQDLPIIAITTVINEKIKQSLMKNNLVYVLSKPLDAKVLHILLNKLSKDVLLNKGED